MGARALRRPRLKRWQVALLFLMLLGGGAMLFHFARDTRPPKLSMRQQPPVGAYAIARDEKGRTDFAMQTERGRFGLRVGSDALADMPYGLPLYPKAHLEDSASISGEGADATGRIIRFRSTDAPAKVIAFYRSQAKDALLDIVSDQRIGTTHVLAAAYPDRRDGGFQLTVTGGEAEGSDAMLSSGFGQDVTDKPPLDPALVKLESRALLP